MRFLILISAFLFSSFTFARGLEGAAGIGDRVNKFVNSPRAYRSLLEYQSLGFSGKVINQPWSSTYWPLTQGMAAFAYGDYKGRSRNAHRNHHRFENRIRDFQKFIEKNHDLSEILEVMSPSEKYDLYLGDTSFTFSHAIWSSIFEYKGSTRRKKIQYWEGVCHGWAAAAAYMKRPRKKFEVKSIDHRFTIPFYPDDLKALSSVLWANSLVQDFAVIEGLRCDTNKPQLDYGSGKVLRTRCKGVNPGVWHLSLLGLVGEKGLPFVVNKNNDIEIWNQPVNQYEFYYYSPITGESGNLETVAVNVKDYTGDIFAEHRDPKTVFIVGVDMNLEYINETEPTQENIIDEPSLDLTEKLHMRYELELDAGFNVLGGEWTETVDQARWIPNYPAFMWRFPSDTPFAASIVDAKTPNPHEPKYHDTKLMRELSREASSFRYQRYKTEDEGDIDMLELDDQGNPVPAFLELRPQPIGKIIYELMEKAQ